VWCLYGSNCVYIYTYEQHFLSNISHTDILSNIHEKQLHYIYIYIYTDDREYLICRCKCSRQCSKSIANFQQIQQIWTSKQMRWMVLRLDVVNHAVRGLACKVQTRLQRFPARLKRGWSQLEMTTSGKP